MNLETERLILVPVSEQHIGPIYEHFNEQIITYMEPTVAKDISETREVVRHFMEGSKNNTDIVYAITLKEDGAFIGLVGMHLLKEELPELGVWTKLDAHGNHYGREAVGGAIAHAKELGIAKMCYPVDRRNIPSKKIALFYGGDLVKADERVETQDGRILEEEIYEIMLIDSSETPSA